MTQVAAKRSQTLKRADKLRFSSPHGILYALPVSAALWAAVLFATGILH
jgi:hypothetical protein